MANITPRDIDFAEVHDCFTIAEIIDIVRSRFLSERNCAQKGVLEGATRRK